jgi:hypothetical protein
MHLRKFGKFSNRSSHVSFSFLDTLAVGFPAILNSPYSCQMTSPSLRISHPTTQSVARTPLVINHAMGNRVASLAEEAVQVLKDHRDRITGRSLVRAAMGLIGEPLGGADLYQEKDVAGEHLDESDFAEMCHNADGLVRKVNEAIHANEYENIIAYLKSLHRLLGNGTGSGSLTPRPRDYAAAMSRFNEGSLSSPSQQRGSTHMERLEHAHSHTQLRP